MGYGERVRGSEESVTGGAGKRNRYLEKFWTWIGDRLGSRTGLGAVLGGCLHARRELLVGTTRIEDSGDGAPE